MHQRLPAEFIGVIEQFEHYLTGLIWLLVLIPFLLQPCKIVDAVITLQDEGPFKVSKKKISLSSILLHSSLCLIVVSSRFYFVFIGILAVYLLLEFFLRKKVRSTIKLTQIHKDYKPAEIVLPEKNDEIVLLEKNKIKEEPEKTVNVETKEKESGGELFANCFLRQRGQFQF